MKKTTAIIRAFVARWKGKGNEKQEYQVFWEELAECLLGVKHGRECFDFQKPVPKRAVVVEDGKSPKFLDVYLKASKCVIEQKSHDISLDKPHAQSDGKKLNALEQAQRYYDNLNLPEKGRYTIACNFQEFRIFDNYHSDKDPEKLLLEELPRRWRYLRGVLSGLETATHEEMQEAAAKTASGFVAHLYSLLQKQYSPHELTPDILHQFNVFCVRVVFCLYADDAEVFDNNQFHAFLNTFDARKLQEKFRWLFLALNQPISNRPDSYDIEIKGFPYVNGGLFGGSEVPIPRISDEIRELLLDGSNHLYYINDKDKGPFEWSLISPTNFGCIFESTLDPATREKNGMHYTSPENIHRVIDPLFLDDLTGELNTIFGMPVVTKQDKEQRESALRDFRKKISKLRFLDPACGSGNFLTETFKSLRRLEMRIVSELPNYGIEDGVITEKNQSFIKNPCWVSINQFYGIEINDFAVQVANTALWISDCQMIAEAEEAFNVSINPLPLLKNQNIHCGNALEMNWEQVISPRSLDYIIGNPPFKGARGGGDSKEEKERKKAQMQAVMSDRDAHGKPVWQSIGNFDYVCAWYARAAQYMQQNSAIRAALVSTNSIVQGEQAVLLWQPLMEHFNARISFAWRSFVWNNQAKKTAQVHCVIVGFYCSKRRKPGDCHIYQENEEVITCGRINNYLYPYPCYFINPGLTKPLCDVPKIGIGNKPIDGGHYLFSEAEMENFIAKEPGSAEFFHKWYGAVEFTTGVPRYCLWLGECEPHILDKLPNCRKRIEAVRAYRLKSDSVQTRQLALKPTRFHVENMPKSDYLVIPQVTTQRRDYIPFGYMTPDVLCGDKVRLMPNAALYHFGILESSIHMAWVKMVCGRMKSDYSYSIEIVYNNFPWPKGISSEQIGAIEQTASQILDARKNHPDSTLRQLYDPAMMPADLTEAHQANDRAVLAAYASMGITQNMNDEEIALILLRESVRLSTKAKSKNKA